MVTDNISSVLSIVAIGVAIMVGGIAQTDWKHKYLVNSLIGCGLLVVALGISFPWTRDLVPRVGNFVSDIATNPASWFCVVVLLFCLRLVVDARRPNPVAGKDEIQRISVALEGAVTKQVEADRTHGAMIGAVDDKADRIAENLEAVRVTLAKMIHDLSEKADNQYRQAGEGQLRIVRSLRARDALEIVKVQADEALELGNRLMAAEQSHYPNDTVWLDQYGKWKDALNIVDTVLGHWQDSHRPFLDVSAQQVERVHDMPPSNISSDRTITQFKRLCLVNERFQSNCEYVLSYFREKSVI